MNDGRVFVANGVGPGRRATMPGLSLYGHYDGDEGLPPVEVSAMDIDERRTTAKFGEDNAWNSIIADQLVTKRRKLVRKKNHAIQAGDLARKKTIPDDVETAKQYTEAARLEAAIAVTYLEQLDYRNAQISLLSANSCATLAALAAERLGYVDKPPKSKTKS